MNAYENMDEISIGTLHLLSGITNWHNCCFFLKQEKHRKLRFSYNSIWSLVLWYQYKSLVSCERWEICIRIVFGSYYFHTFSYLVNLLRLYFLRYTCIPPQIIVCRWSPFQMCSWTKRRRTKRDLTHDVAEWRWTSAPLYVLNPTLSTLRESETSSVTCYKSSCIVGAPSSLYLSPSSSLIAS